MRREKPFVWVTWITGLLAGSASCEWAAWFRANHKDFEKRERNTDLAVWTAEHGALVRQTAARYKDTGWTVYVEDQNKFFLHGKKAVLSGTPDIVAVRQKPDMLQREAVVIDCKTGKPRDGDIFQVLIYMLALPRTHKACEGLELAGQLVYKDQAKSIEPERLDDSVRELIAERIKAAAGDQPAATPSYNECRFCDIGSDCTVRVETEPAQATSDMF